MGKYSFSSLYKPARPVSEEQSGKQRLQITNISGDRSVLLVKHLTEPGMKGSFTPLSERVRSIRASSLGGECAADIWLSIHGHRGVVEERAQNIFDVGTAMEPFILAWLQDQLGWEVNANSRDEEGIIIALRGGVITGHIDALARHPLLMKEGLWGLCDAKTMNDKNFTEWTEKGTAASKPGYDVQLEVYAHAYSRFLPVEHKVLVAMNKNNSSFSAEVMDRDPGRWSGPIKSRAEALLEQEYFEPPVEKSANFCAFCFRKEVCGEMRTSLEKQGGQPAKRAGRDPLSGSVPSLGAGGNLLHILALAYELYDKDMKLIKPDVGRTLDDLGELYDDGYVPYEPPLQGEEYEQGDFDNEDDLTMSIPF